MSEKNIIPTTEEFQKEVEGFKSFEKVSNENAQHHREISFDICYNYFLRHREHLSDDMEKSCTILWSYLASWGMLRGSSFLLQKNPAYLIDLVKYIQSDCQGLFEIDVDKYDDAGVIKRIIDGYDDIYNLLGGKDTNPSSTLITKVMLGVFGCVPAYDTYFCETFYRLMPDKDFRYKKVNEVSLGAVYEFYKPLSKEIDRLVTECKIVDPFKPEAQNGCYSKAKIIDMYGFNVSLTKAAEEKERAAALNQ